MSVTVTMHVYSGRPDPSWELTKAQADELADKIARIDKTTLMKPPGMVGGLGYRGFSINSVREPDFDPEIYLHSGIVDLDRFAENRIMDDSGLEKWLMETGGRNVEDDLKTYVNGELTTNFRTTPVPLGGAQMFAAGPPPFNPGKWNNDSNIRRRNNCYNYANDKITNTFAQPGRGSGQILSALTCSNVGAASERDGQISVSSASSTPAQGQFIALVIWPGRDYHWYRLDNNAKWSHKPGQTAAKNTDHSGNLITSPETCDRGPYSQFCGYYHCIPANTTIS